MDSIRLVRALVMAAGMASLAGCMTPGGGQSASVNTLDGAYQAPRTNALPNDIKEILMAGGLDLKNPSAPGADTAIIEMAASKVPDKKEVDPLVADQDAAGAAPAAPDAKAHAYAMLHDKSAPAASAAAPVEKKQDNVDTVTIRYPDIGVAAPEPVKPVVAAAMVPEKPRKRAAPPALKPEPKKRRF